MKTKLLLLSIAFFGIAKGQITPGNNFIGITVNTPQDTNYTYTTATLYSQSVGMTSTEVFLNWTTLETSPGVYDFSFPNIANIFYPAYNVSVALTISPINTNVLEVPSDLVSLAFDNPTVISRYEKLLDSVFAHMPNVQFTSLEIGNEIDVYLNNNPSRWNEYINFYNATANYARSKKPGLKIASKATFYGLRDNSPALVQQLNNTSDYIGITYYPMDSLVKPVSVVTHDFDTVVSLYPSKPIIFYECGYPSGTVIGSSLTQQAQFIDQVFAAWDNHPNNIKMVMFFQLHDFSSAQVSYYSTYYGITDPRFLDYLGTLGLRTYTGSGTNKPAMDELICEARQRNFNSLTCSAEINETKEDNASITIFPNPFSAQAVLQSDNLLHNATLTVYNCFGQKVKEEKNISGKTITLTRDNLCAGLYFVQLIENNKLLAADKLVITDK